VSQLGTQHAIATFSPDTACCIGFHPAPSLIAQSYTGTMLSIEGKVSLFCTPQQTLYASLSASTQRRYRPTFACYTADAMLGGGYGTRRLADVPFRMRKASTGTDLTNTQFHPFPFASDAFAALVGFAASDGHATRKSKHKLLFRLRKQRKIGYLSQLLAHPGMYRHLHMGVNRQVNHVIRYPELGQWLFDHIYTSDKQKTLPLSLLGMSQPILDGVLEGLRHGDGYVRSATRWEYATVSPALADTMQAISVLAGTPLSISHCGGVYRLYSLTHQALPHINDARSQQHQVQQVRDWTGTVYGVADVPGLIAIRRDKKTLLIGAC